MEILLVAFGWLLGLLGSQITDILGRRRVVKRVKTMIKAEMLDLQVRLALLYFNWCMKRGSLNRESCQWLHGFLIRYDGPAFGQSKVEFLTMFEQIIKAGSRDFEQMQKLAAKPEEIRASYRKYHIYSLEQNFDSLPDMSNSIARCLTDISINLGHYNEQVDEFRSYLSLTFDHNITDENRRRVEQNLTTAEDSLITNAKDLVDRIESAVSRL